MRAGSERGLGRARALGAAAAQVHTSDPPAKTHQSALPSRLDFERYIDYEIWELYVTLNPNLNLFPTKQ